MSYYHCRVNEPHEQKSTFEIGRSLFPSLSLPPPPAPSSYRGMLPSLGKNIYDDDSPSGLSVISDIEENKRSPSVDSPLVQRITNRLETTLMAQLGSFEERVAESIITKLTQKKGRQNSPGTDAEISSENLLEQTIAHAFLKKNKMKNVLEEAVSSALGRFGVIPSASSNKTVAGEAEGKPLSKLSSDLLEKTCYINESLNETHVQETYLHGTQVQSAYLQTPSVQICQQYKTEGEDLQEWRPSKQPKTQYLRKPTGEDLQDWMPLEQASIQYLRKPTGEDLQEWKPS
ncbi:hypothetical protein E2C01_001911 [Portunus trituberculatus]|uniref:Uncharacterized protein n=1 Tax=Portunus trituberculatus TaxID=210409 RepID=A0A5B7CNW7_PORTR|nr:hypothetical protein [Portunus trituberculatus]